MILGMVPVRISFAGGGTDMPEYYEKYGGNVVTTCITRFTYVVLTPRHDESFQFFSSDFETHHATTKYENLESKHGTELAVAVVKHLKYKKGANLLLSSDVQPGSGLGASSAIAVNLIKTLTTMHRKNWSKEKIAETAYHIGRNILNWPIGKQDEYIASFGGFNYIQFEKEKVTVKPINLKKNTLQELQNNLLLFFVGNTRNSATILTGQIDSIKQSKSETMKSLDYVKDLASEMYHSLKRSDITAVGELLHNGWMAKKKFVKGVSNEHIDKMYESALKYGAIGGKLTGAGGGGHMLLYCEGPKQKKVIDKMIHLGLKQVKFSFHSEGPKVLNLYDFSK